MEGIFVRNSSKFLGALAVAGLVAVGGSAFTATSSIDSSQKYVGAVGQTISGVTVTSVKYTVGAGDTTTAVDFDVAEVLGAGDTVSAALNGGTPEVCAQTAVPPTGTQLSTHLACDFGAGVANVTSLSIVAS
jgi:hypothetical protein